MEVVLLFALIVSIIRSQAYKVSLKALGIYFQKKGYIQPSDRELRECSQIAIKQMFKAGVR